MNQNEVVRISGPADPRRCQGVGGMGQCNQIAMEGVANCAMHGGGMAMRKIEKETNNNYKILKYQERLKEKSGSGSVKSLRDEIGLLRMLIEERINLCNTPTDLIMSAGAISDMVVKVEKLVTSCHRIEGSMGQLLDKSTLIQFADRVVSIIAESVSDSIALDAIATKIMGALEGKDAIEVEATVTKEQAASNLALLDLDDDA